MHYANININICAEITTFPRSPVFKAMIQGDTLEAKRGEISVLDVDPDSFGVMLRYVYTGELGAGAGQDLELQHLLNVAEKYHLPGLKELLFRMKSEDIKEEFIPDMLILADRYQAGQLKEFSACLAGLRLCSSLEH